jgi:peptidoglycan/LPS O-acetylase OafA/YrhL
MESKMSKMPLQVCQPLTLRSGGLSKLEPRPLGATTSAHLDLIRAVAAWAVLWGHLRNMFFADFQYVQHRNSFTNVIYFLTGFGHQAVIVFFVLSGFLISSAILKRHASGTWSWRGYAIDRLSRLYTVLIPGLLSGLLWDKAGASIFVSTGVYAHPLEGFGPAIAQSRITVGTFVGNILFLQTIACPTFGSNGPLWSLANEFWYYVLFPLGLAAGLAWANKVVGRAILLTILTICVAAFVKSAILAGFVVWMAGCILVIAYSRFRLSKLAWLILYLLFSSLALFVCLAAARARDSSVLGSDLALGLAFTLFLFGILQLEFGTGSDYYPRSAHRFAGFSYSLYVLHFPLLLFLKAWLAPSQKWQPDALHLFYGAILSTIALSFAWLVSLFTENKTRSVRNWMDYLAQRAGRAVARTPPVEVGLPPSLAAVEKSFN